MTPSAPIETGVSLHDPAAGSSTVDPDETRRQTTASLDPFLTNPTLVSGEHKHDHGRSSTQSSGDGHTKNRDNHMPVLDGLAKRLGSKALEKVTLDEVLEGGSCSPISFREFQNFITHKEYTIENLLFLIWFRSYQRRFERLSEEERKKVDVPSGKLGEVGGPFGHLRRNMGTGGRRKTLTLTLGGRSISSGQGGTDDNEQRERRSSSIPLQSIFRRTGSSSTQTQLMHDQPTSPTPSQSPLPATLTISSTINTDPNSPSSTYLPQIHPADQPMREEAERAFRTFLVPGAERELNVTDEMRTRCRVALEGSTHPEVFLPIYKEIYGFLEMQTLPHFLSYAQTNINLPKQVFWYGVGLTDLAISILILVLMVVLLPGKSFAWRLPRLVSVLFASFGAMQTYSAWRGFCTQVWGRASRQLHPWELESKAEREAKQADPRRGSLDLEGGAWVNPWADNPPRPTSPIEKGSTEIDEGVWLPMFGNQGPNVLDRQGDREDPPDPLSAGSDPSPVHQDNLDQALSTRSWDGPAPRLAMGYSVGDMSDISPWDEPPGQTTIGNTNSNTHLIFPVSEKEDNEGSASSSAVQRRRSAGTQQSTLLRRLLREKKNNTDGTTTPLPKPAVFGDEIVLVDERVIRLHKQVVRDILVVGAVWGLVWIAVCLAIPTSQG